jgi:hypothetical protein
MSNQDYQVARSDLIAAAKQFEQALNNYRDLVEVTVVSFDITTIKDNEPVHCYRVSVADGDQVLR